MVENYRTDRSSEEYSPLLMRRHSLQPPSMQRAAHDACPNPSKAKQRSRLSLGSMPSFSQKLYSASLKHSQGRMSAPDAHPHNGEIEHYKPDSDVEMEEYDMTQTTSWLSATDEQRRYSFKPGHSVENASTEAHPPVVNPAERQVNAEMHKLVAMQRTVTALRLEVQERRKGLQRLRNKVADADREFMDVLRVSWATGGLEDRDRLEPLYNRCVQARDAVGNVVDDYERLELRLSSEEFKLTESMGEDGNWHRSQENRPARHDPTNQDESVFSYSSSSDDHESIDPRNTSTLHGIYLGDHLSVGQQPQRTNTTQRTDTAGSPGIQPLPIVERQSITLASEDEVKTNKVDMSTKVPIDISAPDLVQTDWDHLDVDSRRPEFNDPDPSDDIILEEVSDSMEGSFRGSELLFRSAMIKEVNSSYFEPEFLTPDSSKYLQKFDNAHNRIDRWLLHQLRLSVREIFQLRDQFVYRYAKYNRTVDGWPSLVLKFWETDPPSYDETSPLRNTHKLTSSKDDSYTGYPQRHSNPVPVIPNTIFRHNRSHADNEYRNPMGPSPNEVISANGSSNNSLVKIPSMKAPRGVYTDQASASPLP